MRTPGAAWVRGSARRLSTWCARCRRNRGAIPAQAPLARLRDRQHRRLVRHARCGPSRAVGPRPDVPVYSPLRAPVAPLPRGRTCVGRADVPNALCATGGGVGPTRERLDGVAVGSTRDWGRWNFSVPW